MSLHNQAPMHIFKAALVFDVINQFDFESFL